MGKFCLRLMQLKAVGLLAFSKMLSFLNKEKCWVIFERGDDARDNAYWFYRYMKRHHPDQKIYYIIDKKSADYYKVQSDAVQYSSIKSYWILVNAEKIISTHYAFGFPGCSQKIFQLCGLNKKLYFLQHGIIKDDIPALYGNSAPMQMFVCGAAPEYEYVRDTYGHPEGVVQYTGLARFDQLHDIHAKKQILVMPTWRQYVKSWEEFLASDYFRCWQDFLNTPALIDYLRETKTQLVFYVHYEMQKYINAFSTSSEWIHIARFADYDVQTLLKESAVLVTDYSSVFFDFAYMRKPMVYFQFDEDSFFAGHYQRGYFDYRKNGFGEVCTDVEQAVSALLKICRNSYEAEAYYLDRIKDFFPLYDCKNCERIYQAIQAAGQLKAD